MAKVIWKPVQNSAPEIFSFLESFTVSYSEYIDLLSDYNKVSTVLENSTVQYSTREQYYSTVQYSTEQ